MARRPILPRLAVWGGLLALLLLLLLGMRAVSRSLRESVQLSSLPKGYQAYTAPPFVVFSRLNPESSRVLAQGVARFTTAFLEGPGKEFGLRPIGTKGISLVLFDDMKTLQDFFQKTNRDSLITVEGFYDPPEGLIAIPAPNDASGRETARHEAVHLCFDLGSGTLMPRHSRWVTEGLATYFAVADPGSESDPDHSIRGGVSPDRLRAYRAMIGSAKAPSVAEVLDADARRFYGERSGEHYAIAHLVVAWLLSEERGARRDAFVRLVNQERLSGRAEGASALASRLGLSVADLERQIGEWIDGQATR